LNRLPNRRSPFAFDAKKEIAFRQPWDIQGNAEREVGTGQETAGMRLRQRLKIGYLRAEGGRFTRLGRGEDEREKNT
jgi:hypothetical protein